jgi:hypothetical protein
MPGLSPWDAQTDNVVIYLNPLSQGRVGYVVGVGATPKEASDHVFEELLRCPFKNQVEWRKDIL